MSSCKKKKGLLKAVSPRNRSPGGVVFINNDVEEIRQRRMEAHLRGVMSPGGRPPAFENVCGGFSGLSNAQIAEHYADCIKLSTENKINTRNAFGLHLIDYMLEMLLQYGELEDFQVAGCTLDAGAKIYASRVDSIYSEAYKILGGIGINDTEKEQPDNHTHHTRELPRKESGSTTLEKNIKLLNVSTKGNLYEMESHMSVHLDRAREDGLMLWQLLTRDDYSLVLDTLCLSTDVEPWCGDAFEACDGLQEVFIELSNDVDAHEICSAFSEFEINESQCMENMGGSEVKVQFGDVDFGTSQPDYSMLPCPTSLHDSDDEDFRCDDTVQSPKARDLGNESGTDPSGDGNFTVLFQDPLRIQSVQCCDELQLTSTLVKSEYSYFNPTTLLSWAGLQHWKIKPVKTKDAKTVSSRRQKNIKLDFRAAVRSRSFANCQATAVVSPGDGLMHSSNLPVDIHLKPNILHELFIHGKWKVDKQSTDADDIEDSFLCYNSGRDDSDIPISLSNVSFEGPDLEGTNLSHYELVSEPKKVEKINIEYSKKSKRIDAKRLKDKMWEIILNNDTLGKDWIDFSSLCFQVSALVPDNMKTDLTAPICFVFLLHLANEKELVLTHGEDEVIIRTNDSGH